MDGIRFDQSNPMSSRFMNTAIQNMQSQIASVKDNKELKEEDVDPNDVAVLSRGAAEAADVTAEEGMTAAQNSGELAEMQDDMTQDDEEKVERRRLSDEEAMAEGTAHGSAARVVKQAPGEDNNKAQAFESTSDKIRSLRADVPDQIFEAATQIVQGQMVSETRPAKSLIQMKSVAEPAQLEGREDFLPIMDIHDQHNLPKPVEMEPAM